MNALTMIFFYLVILFLLSAILSSLVAFLKSEKKQEKLLWISNCVILVIILLSVLFEFFLSFCQVIISVQDGTFITMLSEILALLAGVSFIALLIGGQDVIKLVK
ncbi:Uncharacterised protein [Candidatus Tiddalikarchaeum anstoanum]|nr:Uncharacterised protein [Candidatus Tiddalikarchaeum anstoanum]